MEREEKLKHSPQRYEAFVRSQIADAAWHFLIRQKESSMDMKSNNSKWLGKLHSDIEGCHREIAIVALHESQNRRGWQSGGNNKFVQIT